MNDLTTPEKRESFLKELKQKYPDMKMHFINQQTKDIWPAEKSLKDLNDEELKTVNLRKTRPNEIIFDVEDQLSANIIEEKLQKKQWNYDGK